MRTKASRKRQLSIRHGSLPVITITARTEPSLEEKAMSSGAACFLHEPFETEALANCLGKSMSIPTNELSKLD